jgi:hypothetical protein
MRLITTAAACLLCLASQASSPAEPDDDDTEAKIQAMLEQQDHILAGLRAEIMGLLSQNKGDPVLQGKLKLVHEIEQRIESDRHPDQPPTDSAVRDEAYRNYYRSIVARAQSVRPEDFPRDGDRKLYGHAIARITLNQWGHMVKVEVLEAQPEELRNHVEATLRTVSPFEPIPQEILSTTSEVILTSRLNFNRAPQ